MAAILSRGPWVKTRSGPVNERFSDTTGEYKDTQSLPNEADVYEIQLFTSDDPISSKKP